MVHVRVNPSIKRRAEKALEAMGLSVSTVVRMLLNRVAEEQAVPFDVEVPNAITRKALREGAAGNGKEYPNIQELFADLGIAHAQKSAHNGSIRAGRKTRPAPRQRRKQAGRSHRATDRPSTASSKAARPSAKG